MSVTDTLISKQESKVPIGLRHDFWLLALVPFLALSMGAVAANQPEWLPLILFINLWALGYHHVISTFTRLSFSWPMVKKHSFFLFRLPVIVFFGIVTLVFTLGPWVVATLYLYWQWFHYTRQSYGIARYFESKKTRPRTIEFKGWTLDYAALYALPLAGILYRSAQDPDQFLYMNVVTLPVSFPIAMIFAAAALMIVGLQGCVWIRRALRGELNYKFALYVIGHHGIFLFGYLLIEDINAGWLILNIWHNAQYILFVHMQNQRSFRAGIDKRQKLISRLSQPGNWPLYFLVCLGITTLIYLILGVFQGFLQPMTLLPVGLFIYMTINFHHYVVDALIWRRPKAKSV